MFKFQPSYSILEILAHSLKCRYLALCIQKCKIKVAHYF